MKTLQELADHLSGKIRLMPHRPPPSVDTGPHDAPSMCALLSEKDSTVTDILDRKLRDHLHKGVDLDVAPWEAWFLHLRWRCAADWCSRLAASQPPPTLLQIEKAELSALYEWLLIRLWAQQCDLCLQNVSLSLTL